jgi:hypothetical protein
MRKFITICAIASICWMDALLFTHTTALAQAGSTGGTIGKTDKSASGGEEHQTTARKSATSHNSGEAQALPRTIRLVENSFAGTFSITLRSSGGKNYEGTFSHGYVTTFTMVTFSKETVKMMRNDKPAWGAVTGTYVGHRDGNSATGTAPVSNGITVTWEASW